MTRNNKLEMVGMYKEQATLGGSALTMMVASGIPQYKVLSLLDFENNFLKLKDQMIPLVSSYNQTGRDYDGLNENKKGKPQANEDDLSDDGARQKDEGTNKNRTKE